MFIDDGNRRRSPVFLAILMLMVLALSLFELGPRFGNALDLSGFPGASSSETVRLELFDSQRNTFYAFGDEQSVDSWSPADDHSRETAQVYIAQTMSDRDYIVHFDTGAGFVISPGLFRTSVYTSDQGTFTGSMTLSDGFADSEGRRLDQVYPQYAEPLTQIIQQDSAVLFAHGPGILIAMFLIAIGIILTANRRRITWLSQYSWQPFAVVITGVVLTLAGLVISSRVF